MNYTKTEYQRLTEVNTEVAFDYLEALIDHPEKIATVPDGAIVILPTDDQWVNQQNEAIAAKWSKEEDKPLHRVQNQEKSVIQ